MVRSQHVEDFAWGRALVVWVFDLYRGSSFGSALGKDGRHFVNDARTIVVEDCYIELSIAIDLGDRSRSHTTEQLLAGGMR